MRHSLFILLNLSVIWEKIREFMKFSKSAKCTCFTLPLVSEVKGPFMYLFSFVVHNLRYFTFLFKCANYLYFIGPYALLLLVTDALRPSYFEFSNLCAQHITSPSTLHLHISTLLHYTSTSWHIISTHQSSGVRMSWREWWLRHQKITLSSWWLLLFFLFYFIVILFY